jgi:hypothetical protein
VDNAHLKKIKDFSAEKLPSKDSAMATLEEDNNLTVGLMLKTYLSY